MTKIPVSPTQSNGSRDAEMETLSVNAFDSPQKSSINVAPSVPSNTAKFNIEPPIAARKTPIAARKSLHTRINSAGFASIGSFRNTKPNDRLVVVRYFLDRPGYDLSKSACRLWFHPPEHCQPNQVLEFLEQQRIALPGLLVEVYLDQYESYMLMEACQANYIEWNFQDATHREPGILNIRLTDLDMDKEGAPSELAGPEQPLASSEPRQLANTTPAGLFSFSIMVGLETVALVSKLSESTVDPSFVLVWGPYMFFTGGLLQILVAIFQVLRNNLYGATAFLCFGSFWFSSGLATILKYYFAPEGTLAYELVDHSDPWGLFFRQLFVFGFSVALLRQTFVMNQLSSILIALLCAKVGVAAFAGWDRTMQWIQVVFGSLTSAFAFYVFLVELTNGINHREVFKTYKWSSQHSPEEVFGAAGRTGTLFSKAARLRQAAYPNVHRVRAATVDETAEYLEPPDQ